LVHNPFSLAGRVAIITGSTRGIGRATAEVMARLGARVVISSRKPEACAAVQHEMADQGHDVIAVSAHAAREDEVGKLVQTTLDHYGQIDIVVANAGINPSFDPLTDLPEESFQRIMEMNLSGPLRLARHALPHVAKQGGAMVMTSSVMAQFGMKGSGAYGISKAALEAMTRQLAVEWGGRGVRVNAVAPGTTATDMVRALADRPGYMDGIIGTTPLGRIADPEDVAGVIAFLASDAARHMTGQLLTIDGGQSILRGLA
jgi:dehydrogenase/reductase SDR family member 4